jgi:hypothetical protein
MPSIFLNIPSYEDPILSKTIDSALSNADNPENLFFAIASQYKENKEPDFSKYNDQVGVIRYEIETRPAANLIRRDLINKFFKNQDYLLLIDSHMIFAKHWDTILINDYKELQELYGQKVIISKQVPGQAGDISMFREISNEITRWNPMKLDDLDPKNFSKIPGTFQKKLNGRVYLSETKDKFNLTQYASSHFFFVMSSYIKEVGIIEAHNQISEEQVNSFLAFINGWDIYSVKNFNHMGHLDKDYNLGVYGVEWRPERSYGALWDDEQVMAEIDNLLLYNDHSRFSAKNAKRPPIDFYRLIGLEKEYLYVLENMSPHSIS